MLTSFRTPRVPMLRIAQPFAPHCRTSRPAHSLILSSQEPSPCGGTPIRIRTGNCRSASAIMNPELAEMENEEFVNILRQQIRGLENQKVQLTAKLTEVSNRLTNAKKLMEAYV